MIRLFTLLLLLVGTATYSQTETTYESALGVKISAGRALTYKRFVTPTNAIEVQTMFFKKGIRLIGLYEFHFYNIDGVDGLGWYVGPGAHVGFYFARYKPDYNTVIDLGIDGVIGLEYRVKNTRLNISADWQPSFSLLGKSGIQPQFGGLALRYILD